MNTSSMSAPYARATMLAPASVWEGAWIVRTGLGQFWFLWCLDELFWRGDSTTIDNHARDDEGV